MAIKEKKKKLIVIDGNAIIHRAFHALPPLTSKKGGLVNAVYGFLLFFFKALKEFEPDYIVATFDAPGPTFRHEKYKEYKAKRPKAPDELYEQIPKVKDILKEFGIEIFDKQGFEADDIIGTISKLAPKKQVYPEIETIILSGDLDILQLVDKNTKAYILKRGIKDAVLYDKEKVKEKYDGLIPEQLTDFRALRGDPSDNIPGVTGIGEKTAIALIKEFDSLENIYKELEDNSSKAKNMKESLRQKLTEYKDQAFLSKMLAQIRYDVPVDFNLEKCQKRENKEKVVKTLEEYGFKSLASRILEPDKEKIKKKVKIIKSKKQAVENNLSLF